jgi:hypothetical protein
MYHNGIIRALVVLATGLLLPVGASAQGTRTKSAPPPSPGDEPPVSAPAPNYQASDWVTAAQALQQTARFRSPGDPRVVNDLLGAATAYEMAGKLAQARRTALEGARQAVKVGDAYTAANAYVDAARLSIELRDENGAFTCLEHANQLATSPSMTPEQTHVILARIGKI